MPEQHNDRIVTLGATPAVVQSSALNEAPDPVSDPRILSSTLHTSPITPPDRALAHTRALVPAPTRRASSSDLTVELAPWGMIAPVYARGILRPGSTDALVEETDPFAKLEGKTSGQFYREAETTCTPMAHGRNALVYRTLAEGWVIEPGEAGGRDADELRDWTVAWLSRRELRLTSTLYQLSAAMFWGWHPYQKLIDDWSWSRTISSRRSSKQYKVPRSIVNKDTRLFRWNVARNLVYTGYGVDHKVIPVADRTDQGDVARFTWMTPTTGSNDNPYGHGIFRRSGAAAAYLVWRDMWKVWQRGVDRSMGVLMATINSALKKYTDKEIQDELLVMADYLNSNNILKPPEGVNVEWMENVAAYSEGWKDPLDRLEALISLAITGQGLSIGLGRARTGSRSAADVEEGRAARWGRAFGLEFAEQINEHLIWPTLDWNWSGVPADLRPQFVFRSTRSIDALLLESYVNLARGTSAPPPDWMAVADAWQIPVDPAADWTTSIPGEGADVAYLGDAPDLPGHSDGDNDGEGGSGDGEDDDENDTDDDPNETEGGGRRGRR